MEIKYAPYIKHSTKGCHFTISEPMAVALNYGMFRRKEVKKDPKYFMFYDMGAHDTTVSIVSYQEVPRI